MLGRYLPYLSELIEAVRRGGPGGPEPGGSASPPLRSGRHTRTSAGTDSPFAAQFVAFAAGIHRWNVWRTYQGMKGEPT